MILNNILASLEGLTQVLVYDSELGNVPLTGVTKLVANIIEYFSFGGYIAVGILIFSLMLKLIPLPLDIYSRVATKKNQLKMERMRPELERLQKQYANNKELYQRKMMALYKKEGYSQLAACLPTLFTLVFFIIVITAFSSYSSYAKIDMFNKMAISYSNSIRANENVTCYLANVNEDGTLSQEGYEVDPSTVSKEENYRLVYYYNAGTSEETINAVIKQAQDAAADTYLQSSEAVKFIWVQNIWMEDLPWKKAFISADEYAGDKTFSYSEGCSSKKVNSGIKSKEVYKVLMGSSKLDKIKKQPNGYLILVILSIGSMLLSQIIMNKMQKSQLELQSVDGMNGQAAQSSKMMMWLMPIMFGVFSFMYTAAFSIYLILSTLFSTLSTILINKIVEVSVNKKIKEQEELAYQKRYGHLVKKNKNEDKNN